MTTPATKPPINLFDPVKRKRYSLIAIAVVLAGGILLSALLLLTKPKPQKKPATKLKALVQVMPLVKSQTQVWITAQGKVIPGQEVNLQSRVAGQVVAMHRELAPGGILPGGEVILELDSQDYKLAAEQAQANYTKALADLQIEEGRQRIAKSEWNSIQDLAPAQAGQGTGSLALRKPQLAQAKAAAQQAKANLDRALLDLERTKIRSPFNAMVRTKAVDLGSQVNSQTLLAKLVGTDEFWVELSLNYDQVMQLAAEAGPARISVGEGGAAFDGRILQIKKELETQGLMAQVLLAVSDPLGLKEPHPPLLLGAYVTAQLPGKTLDDVFKIPRPALHEGNEIYLADKDLRLVIRQVNPLWKDESWVYFQDASEEGEALVISPLAAPVQGMALTIEAQVPAPEEPTPQPNPVTTETDPEPAGNAAPAATSAAAVPATPSPGKP